MRLGLLGGTFDPPHIGHLHIARAACAQLKLDRVLFVPAGVQPLKQGQISSPPEDRARMVALAIADQPCFQLSRIDLDRPGPHYTVDLLSRVRQQYPEAEIWFIMGEDSLGDLLRWREPARLIKLARFAVLQRPGYEPDWPTLDAALPGLRARLDRLDSPEIDISARAIRQRVKDGLPIAGLVSEAVAEYIAQQRLYKP